MKISLTCVDIGFDCRLHGLVRLPLPLQGVHSVAHHPTSNTVDVIHATGTLVAVAEQLARNGYSVVPCLTNTGRDVQCTPSNNAPAGNGDLLYRDPAVVWAVQAKHDNYWCRGATLRAALGRAGWTEQDLQSCSPTHQ